MRAMIAALLCSWTVAIAEDAEVSCNKGWCLIREPALREVLDGLKRTTAYAYQLQQLCGWKDR